MDSMQYMRKESLIPKIEIINMKSPKVKEYGGVVEISFHS